MEKSKDIIVDVVCSVCGNNIHKEIKVYGDVDITITSIKCRECGNIQEVKK